MYKVVFLRHGESEYNQKHEFTGWTDIDLTAKGRKNAMQAAHLLKAYGFIFDQTYTSVLKRAIHTAWVVLDELDLSWIPLEHSWKLNERHYGALQGIKKEELAKQLGKEQIQYWRRSYALQPPKLRQDDERHPRFDPKYVHLTGKELPETESLKDCVARVLPYWKKVIEPQIKAGKRVLIVAHGNSIRALVKHLDNVTEKDIVNVEIPTAVPLVYELNKKMKPTRHYFLGNEKNITKLLNKNKQLK
ncbi:2,3-diphosphoglycerate-dependent phosphoglycerate mutase [Candidatus Woesearchaeota archaeon]|nr:2,3-diphosphoglycerate-dependent phosphoglycerate mutase [Candidatus Woesearchaeota archaeon]